MLLRRRSIGNYIPAHGNTIRFNNGVQICFGSIQQTTSPQLINNWYCGFNGGVEYDTPFIDIPVVVYGGQQNDTYLFYYGNIYTTKTRIEQMVSIRWKSSGWDSRKIGYIAIGHYKRKHGNFAEGKIDFPNGYKIVFGSWTIPEFTVTKQWAQYNNYYEEASVQHQLYDKFSNIPGIKYAINTDNPDVLPFPGLSCNTTFDNTSSSTKINTFQTHTGYPVGSTKSNITVQYLAYGK